MNAREVVVVGLDQAFRRATGRARRRTLDNIFCLSDVCTGGKSDERVILMRCWNRRLSTESAEARDFVTHHAIVSQDAPGATWSEASQGVEYNRLNAL